MNLLSGYGGRRVGNPEWHTYKADIFGKNGNINYGKCRIQHRAIPTLTTKRLRKVHNLHEVIQQSTAKCGRCSSYPRKNDKKCQISATIEVNSFSENILRLTVSDAE
ncbi:hypothetical protein WA026_004267 [Henosepilachna vigintioctopunctata]|uniref:Uncharacterized protein n=1 Tax=Henosepilachna vigintioctopunctata TaxID=420089 RepID=A0AAW1V1N3_9CUCU